MSERKENKIKEMKRPSKINRRDFMKKAVYSAPSILVLGGLLKPTQANALPEPPSNPGGF